MESYFKNNFFCGRSIDKAGGSLKAIASGDVHSPIIREASEVPRGKYTGRTYIFLVIVRQLAFWTEGC